MKKEYNKVAARMLPMGTQNMICASNGLTGQNNGSTIIGNGGSTSGGGFNGVD